MIHNLAQADILNQEAVLDLKVVNVLTWMSYEQDIRVTQNNKRHAVSK